MHEQIEIAIKLASKFGNPVDNLVTESTDLSANIPIACNIKNKSPKNIVINISAEMAVVFFVLIILIN
jgi:hypothetical protein